MAFSDNPPAFPNDGRIQLGDDYQGMTLRDWFAGQALAHSAEVSYAEYYSTGGNNEVRQMVARHCYALADAMLEARKDTGHDR